MSQNELQRVVAELEDAAEVAAADRKQRLGAESYGYGYWLGKATAYGEVVELIEAAQAVAPGGVRCDAIPKHQWEQEGSPNVNPYQSHMVCGFERCKVCGLRRHYNREIARAQAAATASEAKGPCCEHAGTFLCHCGKFTLIEKSAIPEGVKVGGLSLMQGEDDIPTLMYQGAAILRFERGSWAEAVCLLHPELATADSSAAGDTIAVCDLAAELNKKASEVIRILFDMGVMTTLTQKIDGETAQIVRDVAEQEQAGECRCPQHGSWIAADDVKRMVRQIDVALNGEEGAAKQASLCDVTSQIIRDTALLRRAARVDVRPQYEQLIYAVGSKFPGETRHQTVLRYINEREAAGNDAAESAALEPKE